MGVDLGKGGAQPPEQPREGAAPGATGAPPGAGAAVPVRSTPPPAPFRPRPPSPSPLPALPGKRRGKGPDGAHAACRDEDEAEARELEALGVDESRLTPLGATLPKVGFVPDPVLQAVRFGWMGLWITLFAVSWAPLAMVVMFAWIGANAAYEGHKKELRRRRKREMRALRDEMAAGRGPMPLAGPPRPPCRPGRPVQPPVPPRPFPERRVPDAVPPVSDAERALIATVHRVDTSGRFERADVALVHEVAELLGPLLLRVAERGADPRVRHDLETLAAEHLPRTVEDYLALPADYAREHRTPAGTTPAEELRKQLHLLLEGGRRLRDAVHDADVERQQQQSRFLEAKFRRSELDL
ncbi:hypothetical protein MO973_35460 [Paenibacillus sp. TRM 82003]|uniref:hypothetical protein n=1 Tax=Kineococcus sp. TRM81007 TaxID=2925831 RepID=UPI001F56C4E3|nr:hypothetical protein [Kineococcus sp. TRM81007]MCI2240176.1 hypothetical protein [Kineococcus sp. TRM81007]MCI3925515.1 hypothetical protein [Paenibacillus sp. TRM 82003]